VALTIRRHRRPGSFSRVCSGSELISGPTRTFSGPGGKPHDPASGGEPQHRLIKACRHQPRGRPRETILRPGPAGNARARQRSARAAATRDRYVSVRPRVPVDRRHTPGFVPELSPERRPTSTSSAAAERNGQRHVVQREASRTVDTTARPRWRYGFRVAAARLRSPSPAAVRRSRPRREDGELPVFRAPQRAALTRANQTAVRATQPSGPADGHDERHDDRRWAPASFRKVKLMTARVVATSHSSRQARSCNVTRHRQSQPLCQRRGIRVRLQPAVAGASGGNHRPSGRFAGRSVGGSAVDASSAAATQERVVGRFVAPSTCLSGCQEIVCRGGVASPQA